MFKEFKEFAMRGNVIDMAVGIIMGAAFGKIITSLVNDLIMPPIGLLLGRVNFNDLFVSLDGKPYATLAAAKTAGAPTLNYGIFLNNVLDFVIVAFAMSCVAVRFVTWASFSMLILVKPWATVGTFRTVPTTFYFGPL